MFQVRVKEGLVGYPTGKSAMIHYGRGEDLRAAAVAFKTEHPESTWLCRHAVDENYERRFQRVLEAFVSRFGGAPQVPASAS
jgi:hypothetical protein